MTDPRSASRWRRGRAVAGGVLVLIPLVPIVIALLLSGGDGKASANASTVFTPAPPASAGSGAAGPASSTSATATSPTTAPAPAPARPRGALVAFVRHPTVMRFTPGGHVEARLTTRTSFGSPSTVLVVRRRGPWLGVISALAGNNRVGWIAASATTLSRVPWKITADLARHQLTVYDDGHRVKRYTIAIGKPSAPTPTGRYAVTDRLDTGDPAGPYGCCILALSAKAPHAISGWDGGDRIAIHSTPGPVAPDSISHGCMHVTIEEGRWLLDHVPLGTPVIVTA